MQSTHGPITASPARRSGLDQDARPHAPGDQREEPFHLLVRRPGPERVDANDATGARELRHACHVLGGIAIHLGVVPLLPLLLPARLPVEDEPGDACGERAARDGQVGREEEELDRQGRHALNT